MADIKFSALGNMSALTGTEQFVGLQGAGAAKLGTADQISTYVGLGIIAGLDTQVIFNDGGSAFGGDAGFTYDKTTNTLKLFGTGVAANVHHSIFVDGGDASFFGWADAAETTPTGIQLYASQFGFSTGVSQISAMQILSTGDVQLRLDTSLGNSSTHTGILTYLNATNANTTSFKAGAAAANVTYTWPTNVGASGSFLKDAAGDGVLSWAAVSGFATLGANTFTALQTITQASANAGILASTGYSLTGSDATSMINLAGTWNTSGSPTAFLLNITNTASAITAKVVDIQVGGVSKFSVTAGGVGVIGPAVVLPAGVLNSPAIALGGNAFGQAGLYQSANGMVYGGGSAAKLMLGDAGFIVKSDLFIAFGSATPDTNNPDTLLRRTGAGSISLGTNSNGQLLGVKQLSELLTIAASPTSTTTIQKPANSIILGVAVRVTVAVTCTSVFEVGDSTSANRFNTASVSKVVNTTNPGTKAGAYYNATAEGIIITPDTTPSDATGRVRVVIYYLDVTPPTS